MIDTILTRLIHIFIGYLMTKIDGISNVSDHADKCRVRDRMLKGRDTRCLLLTGRKAIS